MFDVLTTTPPRLHNLTKQLYLNSLLGAKFRKYVGHSAHVTNVRFSHDMMRVISVGGGDHAIFQWRYLPEGSHGDDGDEGDGGAYLESNSDDSDSEASDVDELDSDIENVSQNILVEFLTKYVFKFTVEDVLAITLVGNQVPSATTFKKTLFKFSVKLCN